MAEVLCEHVGPGLRVTERSVAVRDVRGHREYIRVEEDFLTEVGERAYLPVGVVHIDKEKGMVLIEVPHEADTGGNRLWVRPADLLADNGVTP